MIEPFHRRLQVSLQGQLQARGLQESQESGKLTLPERLPTRIQVLPDDFCRQ